nr:DUF4224 domain-containing protein [Burkholderia gladioli]
MSKPICGHYRYGSLDINQARDHRATGYRQPAEQLTTLLKAGISADRRIDGTVRARRHHIAGKYGAPSSIDTPRPKWKSDR